ncbi:MAG TPA: hydroxymethylglutaryl-CoA reductase, degradative [Spirochaetia bacterium]|nr:hydroxymethylglutaryl-CoA reductase, degradative [Spirochaetales bacterium]HQK34280.1 hydroxymethylglutaryl-CoA reductase, degradative [Spirochaetales bacterium]HRS64706.1 hydroxymethylglutaryl-CoA reductase, degradative [Spirochaetia bacterium]HRV27618.1 hydroxymethylglutaryl-CoA reductase, degradative [Spirochaetia bacterium]
MNIPASSTFRKLTPLEKKAFWESFIDKTGLSVASASQEQFNLADILVEQAVGICVVPLGLASGFLIDGKAYIIPLAVEEPSVIAAAGYGAHIIAQGGGFTTRAEASIAESYIYIEQSDISALEHIDTAKLRNLLAPVLARLENRGGGLRDIKTYWLHETKLIAVELAIDVCDAMGANIVNTAAETVKPYLESVTKGKALMCILSNASTNRKAQAEFFLPFEKLAPFCKGFSAEDTARRIVLATQLANEDPNRAVTHNKGIMNGIAALALATMNDTRAIEAQAHAWSARNGKLESLSDFSVQAGGLYGKLELPLACGTVGGSIDLHPGAQAALKLLGNPDSRQLARIAAAVGLAQNFAALLALVTTGIQSGHMKYHAARIAYKAGARGEEARTIGAQLALEKNYSLERAQELLCKLRENLNG